ncbi:enoyl-CoA hydratase/isomerase family protein [Luteibaculum oceani]|uniref:Enoyl-CoA hydratase n=1 Tax=Luteibaculum oceani TaxID=1294296 RepID=A0A5C6VIQ1_9FLAO|nr:enoyl-CoA hydratase-related protein [Luteibaculum oceani]TXC85293.1 enoyl-CoA hydratase [Luteibaculum oceani]
MEYNNVLVEIEDKVALVTINRPKQLNALNAETISELSNCFETLEQNKSVRAILLTGSGEKSFVAGADIKEFASFGKEQGAELSRRGHNQLFNKVENLTKPVIALINGFALGGGLELAMSCHYRFASENAKLGLPEVGLGVIPGYGGTQRLPQLVGKGRAMEMIFTAKMVSAKEACEMGLVNDVVAPDDLLELGKKSAKAITRNSGNAIAEAIKAVNAGYEFQNHGLEKEIEHFGNCFGTPEFKEGTGAFLEKRKPNFD